MKKALLVFIGILSLSILHAQATDDLRASLNLSKEEVRAINAMKLSREMIFEPENEDDINVVNYENLAGDIINIYSDSNGKIRKYIHLYSYPEYLGFMIYYFGEDGNLLHLMAYSRSALDWTIVGTQFRYKQEPLYTNIQYNDDNDQAFKESELWGTEPDLTDYSGIVFSIKHTSDISKEATKKYLQRSVQFDKPHKGEKTIINVRRANIREDASLDSSIVAVGGLGTNNKVVEIVDRKGDWYKIKYQANKEGYILGEYLEAVEHLR